MLSLLISLFSSDIKSPVLIDSIRDKPIISPALALGIFISLTIYFIFIAKDTRREIRNHSENSKKNRFFLGIFIAMLNLLPLPYWMYLSITFSAFGAFSFNQPQLLLAVIASGVGTFASLALYVQFFRAKEDSRKLKLNMNYNKSKRTESKEKRKKSISVTLTRVSSWIKCVHSLLILTMNVWFTLVLVQLVSSVARTKVFLGSLWIIFWNYQKK